MKLNKSRLPEQMATYEPEFSPLAEFIKHKKNLPSKYQKKLKPYLVGAEEANRTFFNKYANIKSTISSNRGVKSNHVKICNIKRSQRESRQFTTDYSKFSTYHTRRSSKNKTYYYDEEDVLVLNNKLPSCAAANSNCIYKDTSKAQISSEESSVKEGSESRILNCSEVPFKYSNPKCIKNKINICGMPVSFPKVKSVSPKGESHSRMFISNIKSVLATKYSPRERT